MLGHDLAPLSAARHAWKGRLLPHGGPRVTLVAFVIALLAPQRNSRCERAQICCMLSASRSEAWAMGPRVDRLHAAGTISYAGNLLWNMSRINRGASGKEFDAVHGQHEGVCAERAVADDSATWPSPRSPASSHKGPGAGGQQQPVLRAARRRPRCHHQQGLVDPPHPATPLVGTQCGCPRVRPPRPLRDTESRPKLSLGRGSKGPEPPACARRVRALVAVIGADGAQRAALAHAQHGLRPHGEGAQSDDAR
eukprot:COSAG01_NODE_1536_length_9988_cov_5.096673_1_plen_252_part_00